MWRQIRTWAHRSDRALFVFVAVLFFGGVLAPVLSGTSVEAAQMTQRSLQVGSAITSTVTTYTYSFVPATTAPIQSIGFQACTAAVGTCTAPSGLSFSAAAIGTMTNWTNSTSFAVDGVGANSCVPAANMLCANRTQAANETNSGVRTLSFTNVTNPDGTSCATANCTFYVRISTYSNTAYNPASGGLVDSGTVASSTTQTLTVSATVEEELTFCVGVTTVNDATSAVGTCSGISGTSLSLGVLNNTAVSVSPVTAAINGGDAHNGVAELSTNSANGVSVSYDAVQQAGANHLGALRVAGANCQTGTPNTDQCINSIGTTSAKLTAGGEAFGMAVAGVNCSNVSASVYPCTFSSGTFNLVPTANYNCNGIGQGISDTFTADADQVSGTTACKYAWDETGAPQTIAQSSTVVGGEALILKFAATPNLVTPTGSYTAKADFVVTPSY